MEEPTKQAPAPAAVMVRGISLAGPWGPVYGPVDLDIETGGVTALICPAGYGRTALLLTLAGRMKPSSGSLTVFGRHHAPDIFRSSALAGIEEIDTVSESVKVRDLITEQLRWDAPWWRLIRRAGEKECEVLCRNAFGPLSLPSFTEYVEHLTELDGLLLRIALANTGHPPLLVVGNLDQVTTNRNRETLVRRLVDLGQHQTVITATANDIPREFGVQAQISVDSLLRTEPAAHGQKGLD